MSVTTTPQTRREEREQGSGFSAPALVAARNEDRQPPFPFPSCRGRCEITHPDEVVGGQGECEDPAHPIRPAMPCLAHQGNGLQPAEDLLDTLAPLLTDGVRGVARHTRIDRAVAQLL